MNYLKKKHESIKLECQINIKTLNYYEFLNLIKITKMYSEINKRKLREIFEIIKDENEKVSNEEIIPVLETFFKQLVKSFDYKNLNLNDFTLILENYKFLLKEGKFEKSKKMKIFRFFDFLFNENFQMKIGSILILEFINQSFFNFFEFEKFVNKIEVKLLYNNNGELFENFYENDKNCFDDLGDEEFEIEKSEIFEKKINKLENGKMMSFRKINNESFLDKNENQNGDNFEKKKSEKEFLSIRKINLDQNNIKLFILNIKRKIEEIIKMGDFKEDKKALSFLKKDEIGKKLKMEFDYFKENIQILKEKVDRFQKKNDLSENKIKEMIDNLEKRDMIIFETKNNLENYKKYYLEEKEKRKKNQKNWENEKNEFSLNFEHFLNLKNNMEMEFENLKKEKNDLEIINLELLQNINLKKKNLEKIKEENKKNKFIEEIILLKTEKSKISEKHKKIETEKKLEKHNYEKIIQNLKNEKNVLEKKIENFEIKIEKSNVKNKELENLRENLFNSTTIVGESNLMEIYDDLENEEFEKSFEVKNSGKLIDEDLKEKVEILKDRLENLEFEKNQVEKKKKLLEKNFGKKEDDFDKLKKEKNDLFYERKIFLRDKLAFEKELNYLKNENEDKFIKKDIFLELTKKTEDLTKKLIEKEKIIESLEKKIVSEMKRLTRLTQSSTEISKFEFETLSLKKENLEKKLKEKKTEIENLKHQKKVKKTTQQKDITKIVTKLENEKKIINQLNKKIESEINKNKKTPKKPKQNKTMRSRIQTILQNPQKIETTETSQISKTEPPKKYSYDYLNINSRKTITKIISQFQSLTNIKNCFSEIILRLNSWSTKKKKWLIVTTRYLYIFNSPQNLKKAIRLKDITKIKHNKKNNFIGICTNGLEEEVLEIYKKEELVLFVNRKLKRLGKSLKIEERRSFNKLSDSSVLNNFEPDLMKKYKPFFLETFSKASKMKKVGFVTICKKELFGILVRESEFLALLTDFGILFFTERFDVVEFLPLVGARVCVGEDSCGFRVLLTDKSEKFFRFHSKQERDNWVGKLREVF